MWHGPKTFKWIKVKGLGLLLLTLDGKVTYDVCQVHMTYTQFYLTTLRMFPMTVIAQKKHDPICNAIGEE